MTVEFKWMISNLERNTSDGGVFNVHWTCFGADADITSSVYSTISLNPDPLSSDFISYENLTEEIVLDWCWANGVDKDATEASITARIEELKAPKVASGVPW